MRCNIVLVIQTEKIAKRQHQLVFFHLVWCFQTLPFGNEQFPIFIGNVQTYQFMFVYLAYPDGTTINIAICRLQEFPRPIPKTAVTAYFFPTYL